MIISIEMADEMLMYAKDIEQFVDLMVAKLHKNMHKGRWQDLDIYDAFERLDEECDELWDAIRSNNKDEIFLEAADVANFAMIIASILRERDNGK